MSSDRLVTAQFCDDIRSEIGNKFSLMGCYTDSMMLPSIPIVLPKFCIMVNVSTPIERPFEQLTIRLWRDEETLQEMEVPLVQLKNVPAPPTGATRMAALTAIALAPFQVDAPCVLRVDAVTEEGPIRGGIFRVLIT